MTEKLSRYAQLAEKPEITPRMRKLLAAIDKVGDGNAGAALCIEAARSTLSRAVDDVVDAVQMMGMARLMMGDVLKAAEMSAWKDDILEVRLAYLLAPIVETMKPLVEKLGGDMGDIPDAIKGYMHKERERN